MNHPTVFPGGVRLLALALAIIPAVASAQDPQPPLKAVPGTIALYLFDEGLGTTVEDRSGNGNKASLEGDCSWEAGYSGQAVNFTGDGFLQTSPLAVGDTWTIQGWTHFPLGPIDGGWKTFARTGGGEHHVLIQSDGGLGVYKGGFVPCITSGGSSYNLVGSTPDGWHLLSAVGRGGSTTFYVDAVQVGVADAQQTGEVTSIGNAHGNRQSWGLIDCVRILNLARTAQEIAFDANPEPPALSGLHQFDPATGLEVTLHGMSTQPAIEARARVTSSAGTQVGLLLEIQPVGRPFTGIPSVTGALVSSGSVARVSQAGLAFSQGYHWQVMAADSGGGVSAWVSFGSNPDVASEKDFETDGPGAPPTLSGARALNSSTGARFDAGKGATDSEGIQIQAVVADSHGLQVRLEVELSEVDQEFAGLPDAGSAPVASGATASVDLPLSVGRYKVQCRAVNAWGVAGTWIPVDGGSDVSVTAAGSSGPGACTATSASRSGNFWPALVPAWIALLTLMLTRRSAGAGR